MVDLTEFLTLFSGIYIRYFVGDLSHQPVLCLSVKQKQYVFISKIFVYEDMNGSGLATPSDLSLDHFSYFDKMSVTNIYI